MSYASQPVRKMPWFRGFFFSMIAWGFITWGRYKCQGELAWSPFMITCGPCIQRQVGWEMDVQVWGHCVQLYVHLQDVFQFGYPQLRFFRIPRPTCKPE